MSKGGKVLLQPGFLSTHFIPDYERKRNEKIKRNNKICESHVVKSIATPFVGSVQQRKRVTAENGKRTRVELEDDGYRLSRDEDDPGHDSESVDSFEQALEMPRGCQRAPQSHPEPQSCATMISERVTRSTPLPNMDTQALPPPIVQPQSEALANNNVVLTVRRTRGPTRGKLAQRVIDKDGRLKVPIPPQFRAAVGEHASKLASKIGFEVRTHVMDLGVCRWKALDDSVKGPILQRLTDKFDLQGDPIDVDKAVATQCGRRISNYTYKLKKKYDKLVKAKGAEYARSNPPGGVKPEQWTCLIDKKWNDKKWQKQSKANTNNRSDKKSKHICGSKSLPVRVVEMMEGTDGAVPSLEKIYKSTHFNADTNEWISPECEDIHAILKEFSLGCMEVVGCCARMSVEVAHGSGGAGFYSDGSGGSGAWQQQNGLALDVLGLRQGHVLRVLVTAMWRSSNGGASYHLGEATGAS